jgi:uncharacterized protein (TIGR03083 family)
VEHEEIWRHLERERLRAADLLDSLSDEQWAEPSLCQGWTVHHVAAHMTFPIRTNYAVGGVGILRNRGSLNRYIDADARAQAAKSRQELTAAVRAGAGDRHHPPFTKMIDPLVDIQVHCLDITVPLGIEWPLDPVAAAAAADRLWSLGFPFYARRRFKGRRVEADNAEWSAGSGPAVRAPIETVLLALSGRSVDLVH